MTLVDAFSRCPRAFNPDRGAEAVLAVPDIAPQAREVIRGAAGSSPYLAGLIAKEAAWLRQALTAPDDALATEIKAARNAPPEGIGDALRRGKRRVALLSALADLGGAWPLEKVTRALSDFADAACQSALRAGIAIQIKRGKLPGMTEDDLEDAAGMCVLAMGKMGAGELNYSSDIDLICLFDETRFDGDDFHDARASFVRATRAMTATLSEMTAQGYVFRTDLRLRPDPAVTPVCMAMESAERYYESLGRTWERAAYIKARVAAGDAKAGNRFLKELTPFVWRRHLDFAAIQDAHDMRLAIREHKGLGGPITLPGHNMKLGRGGIREIEFFTQTRQLIAGGRDPELRTRGTVESLHALAAKGWVEGPMAQSLADHYVAHRTVEHRLQMVQDAQTHSLPGSDEGFERLACLMDCDVATLQGELAERLGAVHEMTEGFFAPATPDPGASALLDGDMLTRWLSYPALRSERSREIFRRLRPDLMSRLARSSRPEDALLTFDRFLAGLPAGVQLFSLLEANPQLMDLLIDITGTSGELAQYLSRNAGVFDAVIGGDFFTDWPEQSGLEELLRQSLRAEADYEARLDATRRWSKEWHFRVGVHMLRGLITPDGAARQYSDIARAVLAVIWPAVIDQFSIRHGPPPGRGAVVLGMGSLGAGRLNAASDLDLIVIYDPLECDMSSGPKPLSTRPYYARLTQALITALTAPMAQGRLFEVDMRLRPSGNQGPVATSWAAFQSYQSEEAWVWEHLALTRAKTIAGPKPLADDIDAYLRKLLQKKRVKSDVIAEVAQMRARIQAAKAPNSLWDAKIGPGRLQEIELLAQAGALMQGDTSGQTETGLDAAVAAGLLKDADGRDLKAFYAFYARLHQVARLLSDKPLDAQALGPAGQSFLLRVLEEETMECLQDRLRVSYDAAVRLIDAALTGPDARNSAP
ncbi:Bifunctional glutamine synthetase adenylyltransferase/adenylyl-removing enzyme [Roseobacter fucihabitans]|uniref:Bifunctional glutamine synthetase adenylyltransferase/adenylyl-removing enzyme n=1 Tax=Roseobacter fucihabitans TaxID=1537242 RepID=A0ABZ2BSZ2_9RHOB|nr:glutamine-synthetase adenylyltransferase [Roseobacter litoralis]MBC6966825.1 Glutamate-ammonia-ligase adenylyltransferase [Roseobacter litoralis]